jgi:sodium/potassium-transporting ATPase subunit alpha
MRSGEPPRGGTVPALSLVEKHGLAMPLWELTAEEVFKELETSPAGLSLEEAQARYAQYGPNSLRTPSRFSVLREFAGQLTHFLAILLWIAAGLSFLAEWLQPEEGPAMMGWTIIGVIFVNAVFAFSQEYRTERAVRSLQRFLPPQSWVLRLGQPQQIPREQLVPGDVLLLEEGEQVPADARLVDAVEMRVDNSSLTGEALPARRTAGPVLDGHVLNVPNLVFAGTTVLSGRGRAVVYATGMRTEFGKIAHLSTRVESSPGPLQKEITRLSHVVGFLSLAMGLLFFAIGLSKGLGLWISAIFGIGLIAANVPEGLLPTVTFALAMAGQRMVRRKALIKKLTSVETLGCTTVICTDKTGTLTENRMRVGSLYVDGVEIERREGSLLLRGHLLGSEEMHQWQPLIDAMTLCNNAKRVRRPDGHVAAVGNPTEVALVEFARDHGLLHSEAIPRMGELPFDSDRKRMSTLHWMGGRLTAYVKGAPEFVLPLCTQQLIHGRPVPLTQDDRQKILAHNRAYARQAHRVLAMAMREIERGADALTIDTVEQRLTFLGLVAMMDPPHREVPDAIARCKRAGIRVIMVTGDQPLTALAIARMIGLIESAPPDPGRPAASFTPVIEGARLDGMSDESLRQLLTPGRSGEPDPVFARMAPRHKMRVVSTLKDMGQVVAVTGDGVNDAPALKKADIGIAMGVAGTDVAKETADMILLDDNFATIVNAVEEGRAVFANIRKFVTYVFSSNVAEVMPYLGYGLFRIPLALTVPQVLAVDLGTDMVPAIALGAERPHPGVMEAPPRSRREPLMDARLFFRVFGFLGLMEGAIALGAFFWFLSSEGWDGGAAPAWSDPLYRQATTVTFAAIVVGQTANAFACRSDRVSLRRLGLGGNPVLLLGIGIELILLLVMVYAPAANSLLGTSPFPAWVWGPLILGALGLLLAEELRKFVVARSAA